MPHIGTAGRVALVAWIATSGTCAQAFGSASTCTQGKVQMIVGGGAAACEETHSALPSSRPAPAAVRPPGPAASATERFVPTATQVARDVDRQRILSDELDEEQRRWAASPPDSVQKARHAENMEALKREIARGRLHAP